MSKNSPNLNGDLNGFVGEVFCADALRLLRVLPSAFIDSALIDPMYGASKTPFVYDTIIDNFGGDPEKWWDYHEPLYSEVRRVLKPGGAIAWATNCFKFRDHFGKWFGDYRTWSLARYQERNLHVFGHFWIVQTREQQPIRFPDKDGCISCNTPKWVRSCHPCPKAVEEMEFLVDALVPPGGVVLDPFCGVGTTLVAAERLGRLWIGCDLSKTYCQVAMARVAEVRQAASRAEKEQVQLCPASRTTGR